LVWDYLNNQGPDLTIPGPTRLQHSLGKRTQRNLQSAINIFLDGTGASAEGDRPFLDRFNMKLSGGRKPFRSDSESYRKRRNLLSDDGKEVHDQARIADRCRRITTFATLTVHQPQERLTVIEKASRLFQDQTPQLRRHQKTKWSS